MVGRIKMGEDDAARGAAIAVAAASSVRDAPAPKACPKLPHERNRSRCLPPLWAARSSQRPPAPHLSRLNILVSDSGAGAGPGTEWGLHRAAVPESWARRAEWRGGGLAATVGGSRFAAAACEPQGSPGCAGGGLWCEGGGWDRRGASQGCGTRGLGGARGVVRGGTRWMLTGLLAHERPTLPG